jgi:hypothetical protein
MLLSVDGAPHHDVEKSQIIPRCPLRDPTVKKIRRRTSVPMNLNVSASTCEDLFGGRTDLYRAISRDIVFLRPRVLFLTVKASSSD